MMHRRAKKAFNHLIKHYAGQMIAVASHGQLIHVLVAQIMGIADGVYGRFSMRGNTGLSIIEVGKGSPVITQLNDTAHLEQL